MRITIIGSHGLTVDIEQYLPKDVSLDALEIVTGGAAGIEQMAERFADRHNLPKLVIKPDHSLHGETAAHINNNLIISAADYIICIWDGASKGTHDTMDYAIRSGKPTLVVVIDPASGVEISRKTYNE